MTRQTKKLNKQQNVEEMTQAEYDAMIDAEDSVDEAEQAEQTEQKDLHQDLVKLPDICMIDLGNLKTKSGKIRYLINLGYSRSDIANHLKIRYQHVFNVENTTPKRAAREDLPEQIVLRTDIVHGDQGLDNPTTLKDLGLM